MKNTKKILFVLFLFAILLSSNIVRAEGTEETPLVSEEPQSVTIHLTITGNSGSIYDQDMDVEACNSDNASTENLELTAYCAVLQAGVDSDWNWAWAPGAFLNSINGIEGFTSKDSSGNDVYHYWSWDDAGSDAENTTALNQFLLKSGDHILVTFIDPVDSVPPAEENEESNTHHHNSGGGSKKSTGKVLGEETKASFNVAKAFQFLMSKQKENGSFGEDIYTDWTAVGIASLETQAQKIQPLVKLVKYMSTSKPAGTLLTDYERHAMALMSLGLDPYSIHPASGGAGGENYIAKIIASFDGRQFGDGHEDNDDIFALLVLQNAGYSMGDKIIADDVAFVIQTQYEDGSWNESVDMTGAGIQALSAFKDEEQVKNSLAKAKEFLKKTQKEDGSWGDDASSTAWAIGGIAALGEKPEDWKKGEFTPLDYLATVQDTDGGVKDENIQNKIWKTAYVVSALSGKTWSEVLQKFEKIEPAIATAPIKIAAVKPKPVAPKSKAAKPEIKAPADIPAASVTSDPSPEPTSPQSESPAPEATEIHHESWFSKLLGKIFGF